VTNVCSKNKVSRRGVLLLDKAHKITKLTGKTSQKGILKLVQNDLTVTRSRRHRNYVKANAN